MDRRRESPRGQRMLVCAWQYPAYSETFIRDHIQGMASLGYSVKLLVHVAGKGFSGQVDSWLQVRYWPNGKSFFNKIRTAFVCLLCYPYSLLRVGVRLLHRKTNGQASSLLLWARAVVWLSHNPKGAIVHAHFAQQGMLVAQMCELGYRPKVFVVSLHGFDVNRPLFSSLRPYELLWKYADTVTVGTRFMKDRAVALGCPESKIVVWPVGVDLTRWIFRAREQEQRQPLKILSVSRLIPYKGIDVAIDAIAQLRMACVPISYRVVGEGAQYEELRQKAKRLGLDGVIEFLGAISPEQVSQEMERADVFLYPSRTVGPDMEGQGLAIQEAQASGLLVVATSHGGIPEGIQHETSGVLCRENDSQDLADKIRYLHDNPDKWVAMSHAGRAAARKRYDQANLYLEMSKIYT